MSTVTIDGATGVLQIDGRKVFPIGFSNPPPLGKKAPSAKEGLQELADSGGSFIRTGTASWDAAQIDRQIAAERTLQDAAATHGLHCWLWLGGLPNLPATPGSANEQLLTKVVNAFKGHAALAAYKGVDEPRNPLQGDKWVRPGGLVRAYRKLQTLDANHPVVIIQAPRSPVADLVPYRPAFDVTGADIYPVAYPPARHSDLPNRDISVVGDITRKMAHAAGGKPVWTTLQIAWIGTVKPGAVPLFPTLKEERFMAYHAIVSGARGLTFFGGHLTQIGTPADAEQGWNWTFWRLALKPVLLELSSPELQPALVAPDATGVATDEAATGVMDVELVARRAGSFLYVIAVKRGGEMSPVDFVGLPRKRDGTPLTRGEVLFEYVQSPPAPPIQPGHQIRRPVAVSGGGFRDWFGPHDVHVYRFGL